MSRTFLFHQRVRRARVQGRPGYSGRHFESFITRREPETVCGAPCTAYDVATARELVERHLNAGRMVPCCCCAEAHS